MESVHAMVRGRAVGKGPVQAGTSLAAYPTGGAGAQGGEDLEAVHVGQVEVKDDQVDGLGARLVEAGVAGGRAGDGEARARQAVAQQVSQIGVVVHTQDRGHRLGHILLSLVEPAGVSWRDRERAVAPRRGVGCTGGAPLSGLRSHAVPHPAAGATVAMGPGSCELRCSTPGHAGVAGGLARHPPDCCCRVSP